MSAEPELLILVDVPYEAAADAFGIIASRLSVLLPYAEVEHVGSTAIPGCIGKGDIDVLVRVLATDFVAASVALDTILARSPRNDATDFYVEYDWPQGGVSASVQLVVAGTFLDCRFRGLKSVLLSEPGTVERYNSLKARCAGMSMDHYRERKRVLIDELLARADVPRDTSVCSGVHE